MAQRIELTQVSCPPQTAQANAIEVPVTYAPGVVRELELVIPAGHAGVTGIAIAFAHQILIPYSGSTWIIGDDDVIHWPMDGYPNTGAMSVFVYNNDFANTHFWYVRLLLDEIGTTNLPPAQSRISTQDIYAALPSTPTAIGV